MGFDSQDNWHRKTDVKASLVSDFKRNGVSVVASASSKDGYWFVLDGGDGRRFIEFALIEKDRDGHFYLKTIPESMGPYYFDCPLKFFDMTTSPGISPSGFDFRARVRDFWATKSDLAAVKTVARPKMNMFSVLGIEG